MFLIEILVTYGMPLALGWLISREIGRKMDHKYHVHARFTNAASKATSDVCIDGLTRGQAQEVHQMMSLVYSASHHGWDVKAGIVPQEGNSVQA